jgi:hypothetical protein
LVCRRFARPEFLLHLRLATMNQKSSLPKVTQSVSRALTANNLWLVVAGLLTVLLVLIFGVAYVSYQTNKTLIWSIALKSACERKRSG